MIAFTDAQRSSAADQLQAYAPLTCTDRLAAEHCADLALAAVVEDVEGLLIALKEIRDEDYRGPVPSSVQVARVALAKWES